MISTSGMVIVFMEDHL